ncbi:MAG: T9SS type A sorting domain-containing protein [Thermoflexibacter sp.]|nr:T9SS type A sorting domain-containing protein [Thermoflexibacter sp.]
MDCFDCEIISIYPNPSSSGIFTIIQNLDKEEGRAFSITNALGIIISEGKINQLSNIIDLSSQPKGVYFFTIRFPKENKVYKLVID